MLYYAVHCCLSQRDFILSGLNIYVSGIFVKFILHPLGAETVSPLFSV